MSTSKGKMWKVDVHRQKSVGKPGAILMHPNRILYCREGSNRQNRETNINKEVFSSCISEKQLISKIYKESKISQQQYQPD